MKRRSAVAGGFYPSNRDSLKKMVENFFTEEFGDFEVKRKDKVLGVLSPHAGYVYSGRIASHSFYEISRNFPKTFVILGPNHTGRGSPISMMAEGEWETPLGSMSIDSELAERILKNSEIIDQDFEAHTYEHSIEVQLPFIQYLSDAKFVPICLAMQDEESAKEIGKAIASSIEDESVTLIASTDLVHFGWNFGYRPVSQNVIEWIRENDLKILEAFVNLDSKPIYELVGKGYTMCGYGCAAAVIQALKEVGLKKGEILKYGTSYDVSGDLSSVVGYGAAVIK
ncbi:MAG: MEMO1 family protein [Candidatus Methanofastidiosia archaeon]